MFKALERKKNTKLGPCNIIGKVLKCKCEIIVHLDLIYTSYDQKKGRKSNY
jgi:hypothetical protein